MDVYLIFIAPACMSKPRLPQAKIYIRKDISRFLTLNFEISFILSMKAMCVRTLPTKKINVTIIKVNINELQILVCITFEHLRVKAGFMH